MTYSKWVLSLVLLVCSVAKAAPETVPASKGEPSRKAGQPGIDDIEAHLFFSELGTIDPRNVATRVAEPPEGTPAELVNARTGENSDDAPSAATVVIVVMRGDPRAFGKGRYQLSLRVEYPDGKLPASSQKATGHVLLPVRGDAPHKVPFIVYNTSCQKLRLVGELREANGHVASRMERFVPFKCYE